MIGNPPIHAGHSSSWTWTKYLHETTYTKRWTKFRYRLNECCMAANFWLSAAINRLASIQIVCMIKRYVTNPYVGVYVNRHLFLCIHSPYFSHGSVAMIDQYRKMVHSRNKFEAVLMFPSPVLAECCWWFSLICSISISSTQALTLDVTRPGEDLFL